MTSPSPDRRLAAIRATDVVGYSRLMERNEVATVQRLRAHQAEMIAPLIESHGGRIVNMVGDGDL